MSSIHTGIWCTLFSYNATISWVTVVHSFLARWVCEHSNSLLYADSSAIYLMGITLQLFNYLLWHFQERKHYRKILLHLNIYFKSYMWAKCRLNLTSYQANKIYKTIQTSVYHHTNTSKEVITDSYLILVFCVLASLFKRGRHFHYLDPG